MKLAQIAAGRQYQGKDGEIRVVQRIIGQEGIGIDLRWVSTNRRRKGQLVTGRCPVSVFAKWAATAIEAAPSNNAPE